MILCVGEILADIIQNGNAGLSFDVYCGGAPLNVAVSAKKSGAKVGFVGKVGNDPIGKYISGCARNTGVDRLDLQIDAERKTTLAFVFLDEQGEREFSFYRNKTADYFIDADKIQLSNYKDLTILHLGTLCFSENEGRAFADKLIKKTKENNIKLSIDVNFRQDLYATDQEMISLYQNYVNQADIIKFSEDEILLYTGEVDVKKAMSTVGKDGKLVVVTMGSRGSCCYCDGRYLYLPTEKVVPIDTTGAGDAFYGCFLASIEGKPYSEENLLTALKKANEAGRRATLIKGAF